MTPRGKAIAAFGLRTSEGLVPHLELEFQLSEQLLGRKALRRDDLKDASPAERDRRLHENVEHWLAICERLDYCILTGLHWLGVEDQIESFRIVRKLAGDRYMLSAFVDGTAGIPNGANMMEQAWRMADKPDEILAEHDSWARDAAEVGKRLIGAGAEVVFMCADYCFNDGPWLSPPMFRRFVTPFLARNIAEFRKAGAFPVKHTDGDIMPILDQLVECEPAAIHSLDPMAGVDIAEVKRLCGHRVALMGNVNCALVQAGTKEQIAESARYCLEHGGVATGGYFFTTSNCIFAGVPLENYFAMLDVRRQFGVQTTAGS
jgi:uroporphyrinogen decarboxylase